MDYQREAGTTGGRDAETEGQRREEMDQQKLWKEKLETSFPRYTERNEKKFRLARGKTPHETKRNKLNEKKQNENMMNLQSTDTEDADKHCTSRVHNSMRQHALWPFAASVKYKSHSKQEDTRWNDFVALSTLRDRVTARPARNVSWQSTRRRQCWALSATEKKSN